MKIIKKLNSLMLIAVILCTFFIGCGNTNTTMNNNKEIVFIPQNFDDAGYWDDLSNKLQKEIEGNGYSYKKMGADDWDSEKQSAILKQAIDENPFAIVLSPVSLDVANLFDGIKKANDKNIPIILIDTDIDRQLLDSDNAEVLTYIGIDNYEAGKEIADKISQSLDKNSEVAILDGSMDSFNGTIRSNGFEDEINEKGMNVVARVSTSWSSEEGYTNTKLLLEAYPDTKAIFAVNNTVYEGVYKAIEESGKTIKTATFDCNDLTDEALKNGTLICTYDQSGENAAKTLVDVLRKVEKGEKIDDVTISKGELISK